ncbi:hypothetical protein I3843_11G060400 [Carya illinoinensis]|nr:hypothetical protein I3843_11G060400 [Carya illinoinensis]
MGNSHETSGSENWVFKSLEIRRRPLSSSEALLTGLKHGIMELRYPSFLPFSLLRNEAKLHTFGTTFLDSDNGPDSSLLCRELKWLVEDTIEDHSVLSQMSIENGKRSVRLRAGVEDLYNLWKQRIEERKPFQYIVGCEHWRDLVLSVQEGVLIPRPETELIVDLVADVVSENEDLREGLWADLGTGSGALAVGIGRILGSRGMVIATDLNPIALSVATFNLQRI